MSSDDGRTINASGKLIPVQKSGPHARHLHPNGPMLPPAVTLAALEASKPNSYTTALQNSIIVSDLCPYYIF